MARMPPTIHPVHFGILRALNTYRLLTYPMMLRLGLAPHQKQLGQAVTFLKNLGHIGRNEAVLVSRTRMLPNVFWLTPKGAALLHDHDPATDARGSKRTMGEMHEVLHRLGLVELHIALRTWASEARAVLGDVIMDFDRGANGLGKATKMQGELGGKAITFIPDGLAWVQLAGETEPRLLVIELERGGDRGDLSVFFSGHQRRGKLSFLRTLSEGRYLERLYQDEGEPLMPPPLFLVVFGSHVKDRERQKVELHRKALARWPDPDAAAWSRFAVKDQDEVAADFGGGWHQPGRPQRDLGALMTGVEAGSM